MTISSPNRVAGPFIGSGATATFPFTFKVFDATDLYVVLLLSGTITVLDLTTDYTAALNADQDSSPGGSITLTAGNLATGYTLTITTDIAALQGLDLTNAGGFYPDVINAALDRLTILVQQLLDLNSRSLQVPIVDASPVVSLPAAGERAGKLLMFDANGNVTLVPVAPGSGVPGAQTAGGTVDGVNTVFTFAASPDSQPVPLVFAGGIFQSPGTDYGSPTLVGSLWQIVFTVPPTQAPITVALFA
jgi:hypothetical protein